MRFDALQSVKPEALIGRWRGAGLPTRYPLDGVLESLGWYGKAFESAERVHPLLFRTGSGEVIPLDPRFMPVSVACPPSAPMGRFEVIEQRRVSGSS